MQTVCTRFRRFTRGVADSDPVIADTLAPAAVCARLQLRIPGNLVRQISIAAAFFASLGSAMPLASQAIPHSGSGLQQSGAADISQSDYDRGGNDREFPTNPDSASIGKAFAKFTSADELGSDSITTHCSNSLDADCEDEHGPSDCSSGLQCSSSGAPTTSKAAQEMVPEENSKASTVAITTTKHQPPDLNRNIYYRNRLEFGLDVGWHPINIPFIFDFAVGDSYNMTPLKYTVVPVIASLRWHVTNVGWRWIFRGNMDFTFSGSITAIPRGPETHYYAFMFGIRRNFVYRNWKLVPFFEQRGGAGMIDAKEPLGVLWAQGQNLTFTYNVGAGIRYNLNSKYSLSGGMNYMHISNGYLSEPQFLNYGINVYGPMFGMNVRLGKPRHYDSE
jgi:hypothetical protein